MADLKALKRCTCSTFETEQIPELPQCLKCTTCGGWVTYRIFTYEELEIARRIFS